MKKTISVSISNEVHEKAKADAAKNGVTVSAWISMLIARQK